MVAVAKFGIHKKIQFGIHKEKLKSKILSVGYPTLSDAKLDNVAKFKSSNYFDFIIFIWYMKNYI